jgi:hypothetical protein
MSSQLYSNGIQSPDQRKNTFPMVFQIVSPDGRTLLLPDVFYLHISPSSFSISYADEIQRSQTLGGWVEWHWGQSLADISISGASGVFLNVDTGLAVKTRSNTITYQKMRQLEDLYRNNGSVYDSRGRIAYQGKIRMIFGGGIYDGYFESFSLKEGADGPFQFTFDAAFKVEKEVRTVAY